MSQNASYFSKIAEDVEANLDVAIEYTYNLWNLIFGA